MIDFTKVRWFEGHICVMNTVVQFSGVIDAKFGPESKTISKQEPT